MLYKKIIAHRHPSRYVKFIIYACLCLCLIQEACAVSNAVIPNKSGELSMIESNKKSPKADQVMQLLDQVWSKGNLNLINNLIADEYTIYNDALDPLEGKMLDHRAFMNRVIASRQAFPDLHFDIKQIYTTTDGKVVVSWFMQGTNDGDIPGLRATHKKINVPGMTVYYFNGEKISGHWQVFDHLVMFNQLGITNIDPTAQ